MNQQIEGVPVGCKLVRIGVPEVGEFFIGAGGITNKAIYKYESNSLQQYYPIIAPDNVYNAIDLTKVKIPNGYERDGDKVEEWFRLAEHGKLYFTSGYTISVRSYSPCATDSLNTDGRIILRKIAPKTKKVLVIEVEIPILADEQIIAAQARVALPVTSTRIETRPA